MGTSRLMAATRSAASRYFMFSTTSRASRGVSGRSTRFRCAGLSHLLQGAKSANQRDRGLLPNARHTGQPIGWVTFQDCDVEILRRGDTETLDHGIGIQQRP